jgi:hypothetical protein
LGRLLSAFFRFDNTAYLSAEKRANIKDLNFGMGFLAAETPKEG